MAKDKYSATWLSHTSIRMYRECPRAYFLGNIYRDPVTNHKIKITSPPLSLGQSVHEVLNEISNLPTNQRLNESLVLRLDQAWEKIAGEKGGFASIDLEHQYKLRAQEMLRLIMNNPGPLANKAVKIKQDLPYFWLSEEDNIILCGKIDWMEYLEASDAIHIIDFKTGNREEDPDSLQLPIYQLIVSACQERPIEKASYWYLATNGLIEQKLISLDEARKAVIPVAQQIKLQRQLNKFVCPMQGCRACNPFEKVLRGEAKMVGLDEYNNDIFFIPEIIEQSSSGDSIIL